jgi:hypothetical protein
MRSISIQHTSSYKCYKINQCSTYSLDISTAFPVTKLNPVMDLLTCLFLGVKLMGSMQCSGKTSWKLFPWPKLMTAFLPYDDFWYNIWKLCVFNYEWKKQFNDLQIIYAIYSDAFIAYKFLCSVNFVIYYFILINFDQTLQLILDLHTKAARTAYDKQNKLCGV